MYSNLIHLFSFGTGKKKCTYLDLPHMELQSMDACMDECMNIKHYTRHIILMSHMCSNVILMSHVCNNVILMSHVYYIHLHESCFMVITFMENIKKLFESSWEILKHTIFFLEKHVFTLERFLFSSFFSWKKKIFKKLEKILPQNNNNNKLLIPGIHYPN
jgi:hypothetical protein